MQPRLGRDGVAEFFAYVATVQIHDFQALDMLASNRPGCRRRADLDRYA